MIWRWVPLIAGAGLLAGGALLAGRISPAGSVAGLHHVKIRTYVQTPSLSPPPPSLSPTPSVSPCPAPSPRAPDGTFLSLWASGLGWGVACPHAGVEALVLPPPPPPPDCAAHGMRARARPAYLIDTFMFSQETDMLLLRLLELGGVVDEFIVVESTMTFRRKTKPLHLHDASSCFQRWRHQLDALGIPGEKLSAEDSSRNQLFVAADLAVARARQRADWDFADDEILVSDGDLDEIPRPEKYALLKHCADWPRTPAPLHFARVYYYSLNWRVASANGGWLDWPRGPVVAPFSLVKPAGGSVISSEKLRHAYTDFEHLAPAFKDAGWHMSYFLSVEGIQTKLKSFSHPEFDNPPFNTAPWIDNARTHGFDVACRTAQMPMNWTACEDDVPAAFKLNRNHFRLFCHLDSEPNPRLVPKCPPGGGLA